MPELYPEVNPDNVNSDTVYTTDKTVEEAVNNAVARSIAEAKTNFMTPVVEPVDKVETPVSEEGNVTMSVSENVEVAETPVTENVEAPVTKSVETPVAENVEAPVTKSVETPVAESVEAPVKVVEDPAAENAERFAFSADVAQLMSLIINTFYSNKDVFLRELISNASDALDKIRYQSLTNDNALSETTDTNIKITADRKNKTLTIEDTGIGMTKADLVNNLGTIAKSGTKAFMEALQAGGDMSMIGQFGVGFYSAYLVADMVTVISKHNDDDEYVWQSDAGGSFKLYKSTHPSLKRGTRIVLNIKKGCEEFLQERKLRELVGKHSNFICFEIFLLVEKEVEVPSEEPAEDTETLADNDEVLVEEVKETKPKMTKVMKLEWDHLNTQKALWLRPAKEITNTEYGAFYKSISNDYQEHMAVTHFKMEGNVVFSAVLFIPQSRPRDMFNNKLKSRNIKLYVRRVLISDEFVKLMPKWLSFMTGIVDSDDLPLNISREVLQENKILKLISKSLVKKSLKAIEDLNEENYKTFYSNFSKCLKLGVYEDTKNRTRLVKMLRFNTTTEEFVSIDNYVENMKEGQKDIYYITGMNLDAVKNAHFLEKLKKKGYDCLLLTDTMDEYVVQSLPEYDGKKLVCVTKEGLDLGDTTDEKEEMDKDKKTLAELCKAMKQILGDSVQDVVVSSRMVDSPCCLVSTQFGHTANMERIMRAQTVGAQMQQLYLSKKILELNPKHNIVNLLKNGFEADPSSKTVKDLVWLLYDTSLLSSGYSLQKPLDFAKRIHKLVELGLGGDEDEDEVEDVVKDVVDKAVEDAVDEAEKKAVDEAVENMEEVD
jgi:molecular chaperone HtpG